MNKKNILMISGILLLPLIVIAAVGGGSTEGASGVCENDTEHCPINGPADASTLSVTYIKTKHTNENTYAIEMMEMGCEAHRAHNPGAGPFVVVGPRDALGKVTTEEYYSQDGNYYAKYEKGHIALPVSACKLSVVPYAENHFLDYEKLLAYKYRAVTSKKEKWTKTKLMKADASAVAVSGLEAKMGLSGGAVIGKDVVVKVPCQVHQLKHALLEMTTCQWEKDAANSHAKLPHHLTLRSEIKWKSGKQSTSLAEAVDFNKLVSKSVLSPPQNIRNRKPMVDEKGFPEDD